jgi:hypothetical protein
VLQRVPEKYTHSGPGCKFMSICSRLVGMEFAHKNTQMGDIRLNAKEGKMQSDKRECFVGHKLSK